MSNPELTHRPSPLDTKAKSMVRALSTSSPQRPSATRQLARGLGWFSIGLGVAQLLVGQSLARAVGAPRGAPLMRAFGVREITTGAGILTARDPGVMAGWVWGRVGGDVLDIASLTAAALSRRSRQDGHPLLALAAVAGVTVADVVCAVTLQREAHAARQTTDYSDRSGVGAPEAARGAALATFSQPEDMRVSPNPSRHNGAAVNAQAS